MKFKSVYLILIILLCFSKVSYAQSELIVVNIGDFKTTNGDIIKDCKIGYRTVGELNDDRSNVVLWPTWFTGTTEQILNYGLIDSLVDSSGLYIILVDALTNGVSSSPSNTSEFPTVSIRDMVKSQYELLVNHLEIDHIYTVMGISMGGMQTFEWVVSYPEFMKKAISIVGTPKQSSYDKLVWQTMADLIENAGKDEQELDFAYRRAHNIVLMNLNTPDLFARTQSPDSLNIYLEKEYSQLMKPEDYLGGLKAMISHDIFKSANIDSQNIKNYIMADMLIISATQDHLVNPISSIELSNKINASLMILDSDCGHMSFGCETEKIKSAITSFLKR